MERSSEQAVISYEFIFRVIGGFIFAIIFSLFEGFLPDAFAQPRPYLIAVFSLLGFLAGIILTPYFTTRPVRRIRNRLIHMPPEQLVALLLGILTGLFAGGLFSIPLSFLPSPFRELLPIASVIVFSYLSAVIFTLRQNDLKNFFYSFQPSGWSSGGTSRIVNPDLPTNSKRNEFGEMFILLDTSAIIDGRITDISKTGFLRATLIIPNFILKELQHIADSPDALRRNRGRRGLDVLTLLQNEAPIPVRITDMDVPDVREADSKLVVLAKSLHSPIMTNDYNLNRVAELQGVSVLNINDLANAVKASYLPGENFDVKIIQEGREMGQGIGYLEDGTMVVVEEGVTHMNRSVEVVVTKVLQTSAGRMVFARFLTQNEQENRRPFIK